MFDKAFFQGVVAPIVNPCLEDDSLDWESLTSHFERLVNTDIQGMYINGGTGDGSNMTFEERKETAALLVPRLLEKNKLAIVHVGQTTQREAVGLAEQAVALGAHAVASIPPRLSWPLVREYYRALTQTGANVIVYYIPGVTGMTAGMPELCMMLDIPGVVGIKMTDFNIFLLRSVALEYPGSVVYSGYDEMLVPGLLYGADGCIGTWINLLPTLYARVYGRMRAGDVNAVKPLMDKYTAFLARAWDHGVIDSFEEMMRALGYANRCFRRPTAWNPGHVPPDALKALLYAREELEAQAAML